MSNALNASTSGRSKRRKYKDILDEAWQQHLAPRAVDAPTVISTFAGCGGSSLGYSMAGFRELLAVEWEQNAVDTFRLNFPDVPVYHGDICKLTAEMVMEKTGLEPGELDVLDGSPPCQGFSMSGSRIMDDERNVLYQQFVRLLRGLRPKIFIMENVKGMVFGKMKLIFACIIKELKAQGYQVVAHVMNMSYFQVPQRRERIIFCGVRDDLNTYPSLPGAIAKQISCREAWKYVAVEPHPPMPERMKKMAPKIKPGKSGASLPENNGSDFGTIRIDELKPANTVIKSCGAGSGLIHPYEHRFITTAETKRICSFPDQYQFVGGFKYAMQRLGNSVPPLFMRAIANHIRETILEKICKSN